MSNAILHNTVTSRLSYQIIAQTLLKTNSQWFLYIPPLFSMDKCTCSYPRLPDSIFKIMLSWWYGISPLRCTITEMRWIDELNLKSHLIFKYLCATHRGMKYTLNRKLVQSYHRQKPKNGLGKIKNKFFVNQSVFQNINESDNLFVINRRA